MQNLPIHHLDRQPLRAEPEKWRAAIVEVVGDEAQFRMGGKWLTPNPEWRKQRSTVLKSRIEFTPEDRVDSR